MPTTSTRGSKNLREKAGSTQFVVKGAPEHPDQGALRSPEWPHADDKSSSGTVMRRSENKLPQGSVSFDLKRQTFAVEGEGQRFVPLLLISLLARKFGWPIMMALLSIVGFKYGPGLFELLVRLGISG